MGIANKDLSWLSRILCLFVCSCPLMPRAPALGPGACAWTPPPLPCVPALQAPPAPLLLTGPAAGLVSTPSVCRTGCFVRGTLAPVVPPRSVSSRQDSHTRSATRYRQPPPQPPPLQPPLSRPLSPLHLLSSISAPPPPPPPPPRRPPPPAAL